MTGVARVPSAAGLPAAANTDPVLRVRGAGITYEGASTAAPVSATFQVRPGEVVLLLGPSGCGKSTLALALNGLVPQAVPADVTGEILVGEWDTRTTPVSTLSTRVAMVFQDPDAQLVTGTLFDEVAFGPENLKLPVAEILTRTEDALRRVGLWDRRSQNPDRLSGGGRQRLAIAAALAMGSDLLVLDEPTANLDPAGIEEVYQSLQELVAGTDRAILLVEHNLDAAMGLVDRVVALDAEGRTVADGTVDEVLRERADELHAMGVWLPISALAALRLRTAGYTLDPLPLTPGELRTALDAEAPRASDGIRPASKQPSPIKAVQVTNLTLRRGKTEVLHDVSLDVQQGEFVAVVGSNGAGKTTLIQAIAGVIPPPKGTVHLGDLDVARTGIRTLTQHIGFVFQNPEHQFIAATVFDELAHGLRQQGLAAEEVKAQADAVLHRLGLTEKAEIHPFLLSGGQKRRLSVGTALVGGAPILVLDEPTFGQDRARADELLTLLRELNQQGTTIIVVTHDMQLVTEYADRTVVLKDGRIIANAPTAEVFADPDLINSAGLRLPPLRLAFEGLHQHPGLKNITRLKDLPGGAA